ncbi:unnamed protein product [Hermetia illucens]|uniref:Acyltransferase 3 domain-containing protein n=1 Tax=Hermetia illucens TaxID=343691 RepID=A0A7R8YZP1_HERIL|nr:unnamed protein product [Hermetia illucens]
MLLNSVKCLIHTWYLSVDMQLYVLAPLVLIPLHKWRKKFIPVIIFIMAGLSSYTFYVILEEEANIMKSIETFWSLNLNKMFVFVYFGIQTRAVPWLLGVLLGYGIFNLKEQRCQLSKLTVTAGWVCSLITVLAIIFGPYEAQQILAKNDVLDNAFYGSLSRIGWSLCVIWLIFACHQGYGGLLDSFLSYRSSRDCEVVGTYESFQRLWRDLGIIMTVSTFLVLIFESPIVALEQFLLRSEHKRTNINGRSTQVVDLDESSQNGEISSRM